MAELIELDGKMVPARYRYPSKRPGYKSPKARAKPPKPKKPDSRDGAKQRLLDALAQTNIITNSCTNAGITNEMYLEWIREGYLTDTELQAAFIKYQDMIRGELARRTFVGTPKPMVVGGKLVYDKKGNPVNINTIDSRLLVEMAKRNLPEWKEADKTVIIQQMEGYPPDEFAIVFDYRDLQGDEFSILHRIALAIKARKLGPDDGGIVESDQKRHRPRERNSAHRREVVAVDRT